MVRRIYENPKSNSVEDTVVQCCRRHYIQHTGLYSNVWADVVSVLTKALLHAAHSWQATNACTISLTNLTYAAIGTSITHTCYYVLAGLYRRQVLIHPGPVLLS